MRGCFACGCMLRAPCGLAAALAAAPDRGCCARRCCRVHGSPELPRAPACLPATPCLQARWVGARRARALLNRLCAAVRAADPGALVTYAGYPSTEYLYSGGGLDVDVSSASVPGHGWLAGWLGLWMRRCRARRWDRPAGSAPPRPAPCAARFIHFAPPHCECSWPPSMAWLSRPQPSNRARCHEPAHIVFIPMQVASFNVYLEDLERFQAYLPRLQVRRRHRRRARPRAWGQDPRSPATPRAARRPRTRAPPPAVEIAPTSTSPPPPPHLLRPQNLAGQRPLLISELGLDTQRHNASAQAALLAAQLPAAFAAGAAGTFVFAWTDEWYRGGKEVTDWDFGLVTRDRRPKPALAAVTAAYAAAPFDPAAPWPSFTVAVATHNNERTLWGTCRALAQVRGGWGTRGQAVWCGQGSSAKPGPVGGAPANVQCSQPCGRRLLVHPPTHPSSHPLTHLSMLLDHPIPRAPHPSPHIRAPS